MDQKSSSHLGSTGVEDADEPPPLLPTRDLENVTRQGSREQRLLFGSAPAGAVSPQKSIRARPALREFRKAFYPQVSDQEWTSWRWQMQNRIRTLAQLEKLVRLTDEERQAIENGGSMLPFAITPYYMHLIAADDPGQGVRRTMIPVAAESIRLPSEAEDPLGEDGHSPVPGIVHRYPDRVLFLVCDVCASYCRYCTRSRRVGRGPARMDQDRVEKGLEYIRRTPSVRDVLLSGGDPLLMDDENLDWVLSELRRIPHVEIVRIGTKVPVVLPYRITRDLVRMLRRHHPLFMSLHFTLPEECTGETARACTRLANAGIPLGSQTVLLKGVNDSVAVMKELVHRLLAVRVRPYYLYQCDPIHGSGHFRTSVEKGLEIIRGLRGFTTGYAVPTYVIDAPGGGGKIPLLPEYVAGREGNDLILRNYEGRTYRYPDPRPEEEASRA